MKKIGYLLISLAIIALGVVAGFFYWQYLRGIGPAILPSPINVGDYQEAMTTLPEGENATALPLKLDSGLNIRVLAKDLSGARVMAWNPNGSALYVSRTSEGVVSELRFEDGKLVAQENVLSGLRKPHGLAIEPDRGGLYVATEDAVWGPDYSSQTSSNKKYISLPLGGRHFTRTLLFGADNRLYVSLGSSCDVCHEKDDRLATIQVMDTTAEKPQMTLFAHGLRNAVFMALNPKTREIWSTEMGRDFLGDDLPPDEINIIRDGSNYGWPICYGQNIHDDVFDKNTYIRNPCMEPFETPSTIDLPAHSAPLGLAFIPDSWPEPYRGDLLVAYHGSWNRSQPTGYKIVRFDLDKDGQLVSREASDFISGWLDEGRANGRPVDLKFFGDKLYVSDDKAGVIYEVTHS